MSIELKPCPFCGPNAEIKEYYEHGSMLYCVRCVSGDKNKRHVVTACYGLTAEEAVISWNTRHEAAKSAEQPVECAAAFNKYWDGLKEISVHPDYASDIWQAAWTAARALMRESGEYFTQDEVDHITGILFHLDKIALSKKFHRIASTQIEDQAGVK